MTGEPRDAPASEAYEQKLRRARRGAMWGLLLVVVLGGEHWIRGDGHIPLWLYALLGGSFAWMVVTMGLLQRSLARRRQRGE